MYEVEVKVPASLDRIRERLSELDAERLGAVSQTDTYYDAPHRSFAETDEALRVRVERRTGGADAGRTDTSGDAHARITYKGPLVDADSKTREEVETGVEDPDDADAIFRNLGFEPAATVRKDRERFAVTGEGAGESDRTYTVTLDSVEGVGEYVEVETEVAGGGAGSGDGGASDDEVGADGAVDGEPTVASARDGAFTVLERLGLDPDDQVRTSYLGLLLAAESGE